MNALAAQAFDLIVTGLNLSGVDGQKLIEHVRQTPKFAPCSICFSRPRDLECRSNYSTGAASRNV
ncbi:MAG: hypothetical protein DWI21_10530 [Planctomycetota bacterium]|nr:MAG: hypothetical protein DWI21_10530 [Planctomycetota bacterium]GDY09053.1 hypothetical protein LBMAG52_25390 [Planctomycetia bacterium]